MVPGWVSDHAKSLVLPSMQCITLQVAFSGEGTRGGTEGEQMVRDLQVSAHGPNVMQLHDSAVFHITHSWITTGALSGAASFYWCLLYDVVEYKLGPFPMSPARLRSLHDLVHSGQSGARVQSHGIRGIWESSSCEAKRMMCRGIGRHWTRS